MTTRRETLEQFVREDPSDSFSRYALALELEKTGETGAAIEQLQEVLRRDESYVAGYYHLGRLLARSGRVDDARRVYTKGVDVAGAAGDAKTASEIREALDQLGD